MFKRNMVADSLSDLHITPCRRETSPRLPIVFVSLSQSVLKEAAWASFIILAIWP